MYSGKIAVPPGGGGIRKILVYLFCGKCGCRPTLLWTFAFSIEGKLQKTFARVGQRGGGKGWECGVLGFRGTVRGPGNSGLQRASARS
jgi:hypothetical protein